MNAPFAAHVDGTAPESRRIAHRPLRAVPLVAETFEAFVCRSLAWQDAVAEPLGAFDTYVDAQIAGAERAHHKGFFYVRRTDHIKGRTILQFHTVKRSTKSFLTRPALDGGYPVKMGQLYAEHLFDVAESPAAPTPGPMARPDARPVRQPDWAAINRFPDDPRN